MKKYSLLSAMIILLVSSSFCFGADYQSMSTEELSSLRGTMYNKSTEEKEAFRKAWLDRINSLSPEEKAKYTSTTSGNGQGNRSGNGLGNGSGQGKGGSNGQGGNGQGNNK